MATPPIPTPDALAAALTTLKSTQGDLATADGKLALATTELQTAQQGFNSTTVDDITAVKSFNAAIDNLTAILATSKRPVPATPAPVAQSNTAAPA